MAEKKVKNSNSKENDKEEVDIKEPSEEKTQEESFEDKYNELNNRFLRLYSEFDNYKRRTAKEALTDEQSNAQEVRV